MSSYRNGMKTQSLASSSDSHQSTSAVYSGHRTRADGSAESQTDTHMDNGPSTVRELEGSTLGRNSRDGEKGSYRQRRTQSSGGFLLDSAFALSTRNSGSLHRSQRSVATRTGKRVPTEAAIAVSKKRSSNRHTWHQQKPSLGSSPLATAVTNADRAGQYPPQNTGSNHMNYRAPSAPSKPPSVGLNTDPQQIVKLALDLSESRRRNYASRAPSSPLPGKRRTTSSPQSPYIPIDNHVQRPAASLERASSQAYRHSSYAPIDSRSSRNIPNSTSSPVSRQPVREYIHLPKTSDYDWQMSFEPSDTTLARAEKARQHFELLWEYLRLLPRLPPLRHSRNDASSTASTTDDESGRAYNPLQCIRNRKIRYREKLHIDVESEGWQDVERVHEWLDSIKDVYGQGSRDPDQCLRLPPFQPSDETRIGGNEEIDKIASSPASSLRQTNTTGSAKPQRPRFDWIISSAELLADTAWLEHDNNKAKIVDKDGNKLYPDPYRLKHIEGNVRDPIPLTVHATTPKTDKNPATEVASSTVLPTFEHTRPDNRSDRDRRKHKIRHALHIPRSPSSADKTNEHKWAASSRRSSTSSSDSDSDDNSTRGRSRRSNWEKKLNSKLEGVIHAKKISNSGKPRSLPPERSAEVYGMNSAPESTSHPASVEIRDYSGKLEGETYKVSVSSAASIREMNEGRMSLEDMDSTVPNSPSQGPLFPSITANLSPPSSRSPSPRKKRLPRVTSSFHERSNSKRRNPFEQDERLSGVLDLKETTTESGPKDSDRVKVLDPSPLSEEPEDASIGNDYLRRSDSSKWQKQSNQLESKLRGLFKGGRIAELVGNEVSRVGDLIWRKEGGGHSRQPSYASSFASDYRESDEEKTDGEPKPGKRTPLRRPQIIANDEPGLLSRKEEKESSKLFLSHPPTLAPSFRFDDRSDRPASPEIDSPGETRLSLDPSHVNNVHFSKIDQTDASFSSATPEPSMTYSDRRNSYGFGSTFKTLLEPKAKKAHVELREPGRNMGVRPPVTGLASAEASPVAGPHKRPALLNATRAWSLSQRSIMTSNDPNLTERREIQRLQALLLSSGIKALEISRRAEETRVSPPTFLLRSMNSQGATPRVRRLDEFDYAARNLLQRFESTKTTLHQSMYRFAKSDSTPLKLKLAKLETLVNESLTPRVRAAAFEAENLSTQLNTTSTLAIKQLSDALDKGIRKRYRRLRWIRRVGFVLLEWTVVGVMWWVWLVVMVFKVIRGIGKGVITSIRWVLWV